MKAATRFLLPFFALLSTCLWGQDPEILYLTWRDNPSTTMTVMWHTSGGASPTELVYKPVGAQEWKRAEGSSWVLLKSDVLIHAVDIKGLQPDTEYFFRIRSGDFHRFRTLPDGLSRPIQVAVGGDALMETDLFKEMNELVARNSPDFVIMGGDIAYTEGLRCALKTKRWKIERWQEFFRIWTKQMISPNGRVIPIMPVIGNHDILEGFDNPYKKSVIFYQVFAFPEKGVPFRTLDVGGDVSFIFLDTGHTYPVAGRQTEWLEETLIKKKGALYRIPAYHLAAFPSQTTYHHSSSMDMRVHWVPLFEKHGVQISMEHDNHTFKRTFPIRENEVSPSGVIYLGDGSWGVPPLKPKRHWYLAKAAQTNCCWFLTISKESCECVALNGKGVSIDEVSITPKLEASQAPAYSSQ